jgi:hypothetical protein
MAPGNNIEEARKNLAKLFFQDKPNRWVNGIAIGFIPQEATDEMSPAPKAVAPPPPKADVPHQPQKTLRVAVFVNPSTPKCELDSIGRACQETGHPFIRVRSSRFVGLSGLVGSGASISPYAPARYNVPPAGVGALGSFAQAGSEQYLLGANHVMACNGRVPEHTDVVIRGAVDDLGGGWTVATRSYFVPFMPSEWPLDVPGKQPPSNRSDCALAKILQPVPQGRQIIPLSPPPPDSSQAIELSRLNVTAHCRHKYNLVPPTTNSNVTLFQWEGLIDFSFGTYHFEQLMGTQDSPNKIFAVPGDSGTMVVVDDSTSSLNFKDKGVGLLMARSFQFDQFNKFTGYTVLMCSLESVVADLANQMPSFPGGLNLFM